MILRAGSLSRFCPQKLNEDGLLPAIIVPTNFFHLHALELRNLHFRPQQDFTPATMADFLSHSFNDADSDDDDFNPAPANVSDDEEVKESLPRGSSDSAKIRDFKEGRDGEKVDGKAAKPPDSRGKTRRGVDDEAEEDENDEEEGEELEGGDEDAEGEPEDLSRDDDEDDDEDGEDEVVSLTFKAALPILTLTDTAAFSPVDRESVSSGNVAINSLMSKPKSMKKKKRKS